MSLTIVTMNRQSIWAIADKRVSKRDLSFVHDDEFKLLMIKNDLFMSGFGECDVSNFWHQSLSAINNLSVTDILSIAGNLPRKKPFQTHKDHTHDTCVIFGVDDDGDLFLWLGHHDGSHELIKAQDGITCKIFGMNADGSPDTTVNKVSQFLYNQIVNGLDINDSMVASLKYGASIDPVVSPTFDFIELRKNLVSI